MYCRKHKISYFLIGNCPACQREKLKEERLRHMSWYSRGLLKKWEDSKFKKSK